MSTIAVLLCAVFSAWLIWLDKRRRPRMSVALWLPTLLLMMLASRPVSLWLSGGSVANVASNDAGGSIADQLFYLSIIGGSVLVVSTRKVSLGRLIGNNTALALFYLFFVISVLWAVDPFGSLKRIGKDMGTVAVVGVILSEKDPLNAIGAVYSRCASILFPFSVVLIKYVPDIGRAYTVEGIPMSTGVTTQKNTLGEMILVCFLVLFWDYLATRPERGWWHLNKLPWDRILLLAIGLSLLNTSQSKTALVCLLISVPLIAGGKWMSSRRTGGFVLLAALSAPFFVFFSQKFAAVIAPVITALGRNMTFTGRTDIWQRIDIDTVNPLIGAGFWNFWGGPGGRAISTAMDTNIPNAHCGYVDIYLDGGVTGLILLFCLLTSWGRRLIRATEGGRFRQLRFAFLIALIVYNLSESTFARPTSSWFTALMLLTVFPAAARGTAEPKQELQPVVAEEGWFGHTEAQPGT